MTKILNRLMYVCALAAISSAAAGDLADEPNALGKPPNYVSAEKKLSEVIKNLPDYTTAMKAVHAKFKGKPGTFVCLGDSITSAAEFWSPLQKGGKNMNAPTQAAYDRVKAYMKAECWAWKGRQYGSEGGMTSQWARDNVDKWLKEMNPEAALILFGSNDMDRNDVSADQALKEFEQIMTGVIKKCLENGTVVIVCTVPPRQSRRCDIYSEKMLKIAAALNLPVCDFLGECIRRRPTDWDGSQSQFKDFSTYEVPTIISRDSEHPSCPKKFANDFSDEALKSSGYGLRTYLTLMSYADVAQKVFGAK